MAKIVYACLRDVTNAPLIKKRMDKFIRHLVPDNIPDAKCKVVDNGHIIYGISTYTEAIKEKEGSVCMGITYEETEQWWAPKNGHPEGNYALFRTDEEYLEIVTDIACTRAVWYYKDDAIFIASTSQRAIIAITGQFEFDKRNIPWMLSAGTLAPSLSWSKNIHFAEPFGTILLNRKTWDLTVNSVVPEFNISALPDKEIKGHFKKTLLHSFNTIDVDLSKWTLPISGGYDSRGIACLLKEIGKDITHLNTITWGTEASSHIKSSDGYLGGEAAKALGMEHKFWATDDMQESLEKIFERFIKCCEGRIDHIGGYSDGMAIWKNIFDTGKHGIIRGDECFGGPPCNSFLRSRLINECKICADFSNLENFEENYGYEKQVIPEHLKEKPYKETPGIYRDRNYQDFRMPVILSALSDIKYAYTEILNPFLTKKIILEARSIPDEERNDRKLYIETITEVSPNVPYASEKATGLREHLLKTPDAIKILSAEISAPYMKELFPEEFLQNILFKLNSPSASSESGFFNKLKIKLSKKMPAGIKEYLKRNLPKPMLDAGLLAFRIYITGKSYKMFMDDAKNAG